MSFGSINFLERRRTLLVGYVPCRPFPGEVKEPVVPTHKPFEGGAGSLDSFLHEIHVERVL